MLLLQTITEPEAREIAKAIDLKFQYLQKLTEQVATGGLNGAVIHGRGGIGKTWTVEEVLKNMEKEGKITLQTMTGHISPLQVYNTLMENSTKKNVILLDDVDSALTELNALNILKAATDTKPSRWIHWNSTSSKVKVTEFEFKGKVIVITNHNLTATKHYEAFLDRVSSLNMSLSQKETLIRIAQLASKGPKKEIKTATEVVHWIEKNLERFPGNKLSMRVFNKAMNMARFDPDWMGLAEFTILKEQVG